MDLISIYLYLNYSAIIALFICFIYGLIRKVYNDKVLFLSLIFTFFCFLIELLSYILASYQIRTHFLNYFLSLNYFIVLYLLYKRAGLNNKTNNLVLYCLCCCIFVVVVVEIVWKSGWERSGGVSAIFAFFWTISMVIYLIKHIFLVKTSDFNYSHFWAYISFLISKLFTICEKGFGDLLIESNLINIFIVVAIISYLGIIISNIIFMYSFSLYSKERAN
jgi:hypothetical protein